MTISIPAGEDDDVLYGNFAFHVQFEPHYFEFAPAANLDDGILGAFSEVSGLEATMEHKVVNEGGANYSPRMLAGRVSHSTITLKRGIARSGALWNWWSMFAGADNRADGLPILDNRCNVLIGLIKPPGRPNPNPDPDAPPTPEQTERRASIGWRLENAMPVKFRVGDLSSKGNEIAIEELQLVHEGLHMEGVVP